MSGLSTPAAHVVHNECYSRVISSHFCLQHSKFLSPYRKCFATSPALCCTFSYPLNNPWRPTAVPVVFPGVNTGGVGSYIYEKEPSAVTQPWTLCPLSLIPLLYTTPWPSTTVLFVALFSSPHLCVHTWDNQPSSPDSFHLSPSRFFLATRGMISKIAQTSVVCVCCRRALSTTTPCIPTRLL